MTHGAVVDVLAELTADPGTAADSRALHERDDRLRVSKSVRNMSRGGRRETILPGSAAEPR